MWVGRRNEGGWGGGVRGIRGSTGLRIVDGVYASGDWLRTFEVSSVSPVHIISTLKDKMTVTGLVRGIGDNNII